MSTKRGNGGHGEENYDPETGRYVKSDGGDGDHDAPKSEAGDYGTSRYLSFNIPKGGIESFLAENGIKTEEGEEAKKEDTLESIAEEGNRILGSSEGAVQFDETTTIGNARQIVSALSDVSKDFPLVMNSIMTIGTNASKNLVAVHRERATNFLRRIAESDLISKSLKEIGRSDEEIKKVVDSMWRLGLVLPSIKFQKTLSSVRVAGLYQSPTFNGSAGSILINKVLSSNELYEKPRTDMYNRFYEERPTSKGATYGNTSHEIGHVVKKMLEHFLSDDEINEFKSLTSYSAMREALVKRQVSRYATTNEDEAAAEAFLDYYSNGKYCSEHNKKIVMLFKKVHDRVMKSSGGNQ